MDSLKFLRSKNFPRSRRRGKTWWTSRTGASSGHLRKNRRRIKTALKRAFISANSVINFSRKRFYQYFFKNTLMGIPTFSSENESSVINTFKKCNCERAVAHLTTEGKNFVALTSRTQWTARESTHTSERKRSRAFTQREPLF